MKYNKSMAQALAEVATFVEGYEGNIIAHLGELGIDAKFKFRKLLIKRKDMARAKDALKDGIRDRNSIISGHKMPTIIASEYEPDEDEKKNEEPEDPEVKAKEKIDKIQKVAALKKQIQDIQKSEAVDSDDTGGAAEVDMIMNQVNQMRHFLDGIEKMVQDDGDVEEWVQGKITKATDYLKTAYSYKTGEKNEALDDKDTDTVKDIIKKLKGASKAHAGQAKQLQKDLKDETDLEEFTSAQIARLKKEYEPLRGKTAGHSPEAFAKLRKMMDRFQKPNLLALAKADIPILSSAAKAKLVIKFGMKWKQLPEELVPYIDVFADDTLEEKSKFASVDPKVIDRIEKMMRGSRAEKDSIANMLNYLMPPEVVDMVRYKLKIVPKRGKIKF